MGGVVGHQATSRDKIKARAGKHKIKPDYPMIMADQAMIQGYSLMIEPTVEGFAQRKEK